jgi:hypothetical protein
VLDDDFLKTLLEPGSPQKMIKGLNLFSIIWVKFTLAPEKFLCGSMNLA